MRSDPFRLLQYPARGTGGADAAHLRRARAAGAVAELHDVGVALNEVDLVEPDAESVRQDLGKRGLVALAVAERADDELHPALGREAHAHFLRRLTARRLDVAAEADAAEHAARLRLPAPLFEAVPVGPLQREVRRVLELARVNDHADLVLVGKLV